MGSGAVYSGCWKFIVPVATLCMLAATTVWSLWSICLMLAVGQDSQVILNGAGTFLKL